MTVRCKMKCHHNGDWSDGKRVIFHPVYDSDSNSENGQFFKYTPAGQLDLSIVNPAAAAQFVEGQEYYVDIVAVEATQPTFVLGAPQE